MNAIANELPDVQPDRTMPAPVLRTLAICDLADSTALVEKLGDRRGAEIMRQHDRMARDLLAHHGGREIDKTDGFLILFERPIHAVAFALDYQRELRALGAKEALPLAARIGIHVGDVVIWDNDAHDIARGAKPVEVEGLVKPTAARIMSIARPGQILLSGMASTLAQRARAELGASAHARWKTHGNYRFKGVLDTVQVHEIGEDGIAPFKAPAWAGKAHREIPWWRRPGMLAFEVAATIAAIALPAYFTLRSPPAIAFAQRDWVVVGDLKNFTDEAGFNDSLQTAFRIGLEQSRYVNVLSDLKARETLKLMQRDPDKTAIDRETGSEIAIRDGVRALILPSVAEIGGRVRVTAEVIDPHTQTTVYSESADGVGENSALSSLDNVNAQLRVRLGEALATVTQESKPLEQVATKNLDALRAYSLGDKVYDAGNVKEAIGFYQQAIKLDPDFARAKLWLSIMHYNVEQFDEARRALDSALNQRDRLMPRDALFAEAWQATMAGSQLAAIEKWKNLARLYPDYFFANREVATFSWRYVNSFAPEVIGFAQASVSPKNARNNISEHLLGELYLGNESYDEAKVHFAAIGTTDRNTISGDHARVFAAQRQFEKAEALLGARTLSQDAAFDFDHWRSAFAIALDRGDWPDAWKQINDAQARFPATSSEHYYVDAVDYAVRVLRPAVTDPGKDLAAQVAALQGSLVGTSGIKRTHRQFALLFLGYLAARDGDTKLVSQALDAAGPELSNGDYPMLTKMQAIARAERARLQGRSADAITMLKPELNGRELYLTHFVLMQAHAAHLDWQAARDEAQWLTAHRGRAYAEDSPQELLLPYNVALSDLAWLNLAEYDLKLADKPQARVALDKLLAIWPQAPRQEALAARITALQTALRWSESDH
jgi:putative peptide modification system cyclase